MALEHANQGARHTVQRITWTRDDAIAQNLTGATLTGTIWPDPDIAPGASRAIDGTLVLVTAASGIFDWTYGAIDIRDSGHFKVQFKATYADLSYDLSDPETWEVVRANGN